MRHYKDVRRTSGCLIKSCKTRVLARISKKGHGSSSRRHCSGRRRILRPTASEVSLSRYPVAGFEKMIALGQSTGAYSEDLVQSLQTAKTVYSIAAQYLAEWLSNDQARVSGSGSGEQWKQKYWALLYQEFNSELVPTDQGSDSLVADGAVFRERLAACMDSMPAASGDGANDIGAPVMHKVQLIIFWLLLKQRGHCTAQTFFGRIRSSEEMGGAVLEPNQCVPEPELRAVLLAIFPQSGAGLINAAAAKQHGQLVPFANPFGPSVLHCGIAECGASFCSLTLADYVTDKTVDAVRAARAKHLIEVYGVRGRFEKSQTGLPERAGVGKSPACVHTTLHMSVVREWAASSREARRAVVADGEGRREFIEHVTRRLCAEGRGNVYQRNLAHRIAQVLPSLCAVLGQALRMQGEAGEDVSAYEHDFASNKDDLQGAVGARGKKRRLSRAIRRVKETVWAGWAGSAGRARQGWTGRTGRRSRPAKSN